MIPRDWNTIERPLDLRGYLEVRPFKAETSPRTAIAAAGPGMQPNQELGVSKRGHP